MSQSGHALRDEIMALVHAYANASHEQRMGDEHTALADYRKVDDCSLALESRLYEIGYALRDALSAVLTPPQALGAKLISSTTPMPRRIIPRHADAPKVYNACTDPCDVDWGMCVCGAWHDERDRPEQGGLTPPPRTRRGRGRARRP